MNDVLTHYETLLARHYSRAMGGFAAKTDENAAFFDKHGLRPRASGRAVDLGAGSGFQAVPLARAGFSVAAVDLSPTLLGELAGHAAGLAVACVQGDILDADKLVSGPVELAVCMGDTLSHLPSLEAVAALCATVRRMIAADGAFVLTFRNQETALAGPDRFLPVYADDSLILTCFLEYDDDAVRVTDLAHVRDGSGWSLRKSAYRKVRLRRAAVLDILARAGWRIAHEETTRGMVAVIARPA